MSPDHSPRPHAIPPGMVSSPSALRVVMRLLMRRARAIIGSCAVISALAFAIPMLQAPQFTAIASVMINPRQAAAPSAIAAPVTREGAPDSAFVDSEIEVLGSDELLRRLVGRLELAADPEFNPALAGGFSLRRALRQLLALGNARGAGDATSAEEAIVANLDMAVSVRRRSLSYVVDVAVSSRDPEKAARIANAVVEEYRLMQREGRAEAVRAANEWLDQRIARLSEDLQTRESAVERYRAENGLVSAAGATFAEQSTQAYQGSVMDAQTRLAERQARYNQVQALVRAGGSPDSIADVLNSEGIRALRQRESDLSRRQAELETRYGELHPSVQQGKTELENVQSQIQAEIGRILNSLRNEVEVARAQLNALQGGLGAARSELVANNDAEVRLRELEREAQGARTAYQTFIERSHEISGQEQVAATELREISTARAPSRPSSPIFLNVLLTALCLGLGAGLLMGLILEQLDDTLASAEDVEIKLNVPAIASIPEVTTSALRMLPPLDRHPAGYLVERPMSAFAEAFRVMQTSATYSSLSLSHRIVAVTSALPNEGKTTTAFCLARSYALSGSKTLIIDCDRRRRSLNDLLDIDPRQGLVHALSGKVHWRTLVGTDEATHVHVLPTSADGAEARNVFASEAMTRLLEEAGESYDVVILDCPPVLSVAEARIVASLADIVFLVVRWGKTPIAAARAAIHQLETTNARVDGVALNFVDVRAPGRQSYGDSLYYSQSADSYYVS